MKLIVVLTVLLSANARADIYDVLDGLWSAYYAGAASWNNMVSNIKVMDQCLAKYKVSKSVAEKELLLSRFYNTLKVREKKAPGFIKPSLKSLAANVQTLRFYNRYRKTQQEKALLATIDSQFDYLRIFI